MTKPDGNYPVTDLPMFPDSPRMFEVTLVQTRNTEFVVRTEAEAIARAQAEWEAEASAFEPQVSAIVSRDATAEELIFAEIGLT